ncbi:MAG: acyl-CoA thioesterase domain-containing protein [Acidimicrobiales bacterium]
MAFDQDALVACLELGEVEPGVVEGQNLDIGYHRVFGGQILAQVITAAAQASPDKVVKSLHILFPREGNTATPMRYRVAKLQDGRTFGTTEVVAEQDGKVISAAVLSMHAEEGGLHRSDAPPAVGPPDDAVLVDLGMVPWETRLVGGVDLGDKAAGPPQLDWWAKTAPVGDETSVHQALLAHATDLTIIGTALRPFEGVSQADTMITLHTAVTSHTMWFHQPFRVDDWLLLTQHSPVVANGRSFGRGDVFAGDELVASFAQEAMVRQIEPKD